MLPLTFRITKFHAPVGSGATNPMKGEVSAILKENDPNIAPYCVANEFICSELGRYIQLPIPPCGLLVKKDKPKKIWFGSLDFNLFGDSLPPVIPEDCYEQLPSLVTEVLLFDIWVANADRHVRNLAIDESSTPPRLNVFDHSHALFGSIRDKGSFRLKRMQQELGIAESSSASGNRHCLLDAMASNQHFPTWIGRIRAVPDYVIGSLCELAVPTGLLPEDAKAAYDFLVFRRTNLESIIDKSREHFPFTEG